VSSGFLDRSHPQQAAYLLGVPRHLFGSALRGSMRIMRRWVTFTKDPPEMFSDQLKIVDLAGFFYGKHFYKPSDD
jgi:hypothetical protein